MKIGIGSYTYGWATGTYGRDVERTSPPADAFDLLERAIELRVGVVQLCVLPDVPAMPVADLARLRAVAQAAGIVLELGTVGAEPAELRRWLGAAAALDARVIRTLLLEPSEGLVSERAGLAEILPDFRAAGVRIAVENHESSSVYELRALLDEIADPNLGACIDSVNSLGRGEGIREVTESLLPHLIAVHLKDFVARRGTSDMGFRVAGTALGDGRLEVEYVLRRAYEANPDASVVLEQWTEYQGSIDASVALQDEWARRGVEAMRAAVNRVERAAGARAGGTGVGGPAS